MEKEREKFSDYFDNFGDCSFSKPVEYQQRQYTTSVDATEWAMVERCMVQSKPKTIPVPMYGQVTSSGYVMPTTKPGDYPLLCQEGS